MIKRIDSLKDNSEFLTVITSAIMKNPCYLAKVLNCRRDRCLFCACKFSSCYERCEDGILEWLEQPIEEKKEKGMNFKTAYGKMLNGKKIKRPCFQGYWYIDGVTGKVTIVLRTGEEITYSDDLNLTLQNVLAEDWEVLDDVKD